jgi:hypothetical protein
MEGIGQMSEKLQMNVCKKRLTILWFMWFAFLLLIMVVQTVLGNYLDDVDAVWKWFLPTIWPTLALMLGAWFAGVSGEEAEGKVIDRFVYAAAFGLSALYLLLVTISIFGQVIARGLTPLQLMELSNTWLGPLQGVVAGSIAFFFLKAKSG